MCVLRAKIANPGGVDTRGYATAGHLGNVPSLSRLLRAFIAKASSAILAQNLLVPILGIFQRLVLQRALDHEGFTILASLMQHMPPYAARGL